MGRKRRGRGGAAPAARIFWAVAIVIGCVLSAIAFAGPPESAPDLIAQTLATIRDCMARSPAPWPSEWELEYVDTIHETVVSQRDDLQCARRLQIIREGFGPYWCKLRNSRERTLFELRRAEIRWFVEHLMAAELPGEAARQKLRDQYRDLAEYAAQGLQTQFGFLDPNAVHRAKADHLAECYRNIEAPLLPVFLLPFFEDRIEQIKQRWHDLRYARVDLWRQLDGKTETTGEQRDTSSIESHPDYLLTERSLAQLQAHVGAFTVSPPEYYCTAIADEIEAQKRRLEAISEARRQDYRVPLAVRQTEYLSFLLAALLETAEVLQGGGG